MKLLGQHAARVDKKDQLVGRFNGHLESKLLLGVEEAFWAGDHAAEGTLKSLITEDRLTFERKGLDAYTGPNYTRLIFTSNQDWVVPVGIDERRFMVLEVVNLRANDPTYFNPIFEQMNDGGLAAMLHDLLNRKITSNLRKPPETGALVDQRIQSLDGLRRWLWTIAREGEFVNPEPQDLQDVHSAKKVITLQEDTPTSVACGVVIAAAKKACNAYEGRTVDTKLGELLEKLGVRRRRVGNARRPVYEFPPLVEFKSAVERELRVTGCHLQ
jgi:hypothetical protein